MASLPDISRREPAGGGVKSSWTLKALSFGEPKKRYSSRAGIKNLSVNSNNLIKGNHGGGEMEPGLEHQNLLINH
jgi:hypothetical protein